MPNVSCLPLSSANWTSPAGNARISGDSGLSSRIAVEQVAEAFAPESDEVRQEYHTPQCEREIALPDRAQIVVDHLTELQRRFIPTKRTMVFRVDIPHAQLAARLLNDAFADLGLDPYAAPIVDEETDAPTCMRQFQNSDLRTLVIVATGVREPCRRNAAPICRRGEVRGFARYLDRTRAPPSLPGQVAVCVGACGFPV